MAAVSTLILNALVISGEKQLGVSSLTQNESTYHLSRINSMLESWANDSLLIYQLSQTSFGLTLSQGSYTIGPGANFDMTRPTRLVDPCFIRDSDGFDSELQIIDAQAYGRIVEKTADGSYPVYVFYDQAYSATSTATIRFWPEPSANLTTFINTLQPLQNFSTVSVTLMLPNGYQRAIELNYAIESSLGHITATPDLIRAAREAKALLKMTNIPAPISRLDYGVAGGLRSNILTGP